MKALRYLWIVLGVILLSAPLFGAVTPNSFVAPQTPRIGTVVFVQGTDAAGTYKTMFAGGASASKISGILCTSNDTAVIHVVTVQLSTSAAAHCSPQSNCVGGAAVSIPINSGFANTIPAVNMMSPANWPGLPIDSDGNPYLLLNSASFTLEVTFATALTAATQIACTAIGADF